MGSQVKFYMTPSDEYEFVDFVRSDRDVAIFPYFSPRREPSLLDNLAEAKEGTGFTLWLWDRTNSPAPVLDYVHQQGYYTVDRFASEVIEFSRSYMYEGRLVRGRIWAEMTGWRMDDPSATFSKSESFQKWFKRLANWIRRKSIKDSIGDYLMPGAQQFLRDGGHLSG